MPVLPQPKNTRRDPHDIHAPPLHPDQHLLLARLRATCSAWHDPWPGRRQRPASCPSAMATAPISWEHRYRGSHHGRLSASGLPGIEPFRSQHRGELSGQAARTEKADGPITAYADGDLLQWRWAATSPATSTIPTRSRRSVSDHIKPSSATFIVPFGYVRPFQDEHGSASAKGYDTSDENIKRLRRRAEPASAKAIIKDGRQAGAASACRTHWSRTDHETHLLMKLTDPKYVWLTADTWRT